MATRSLKEARHAARAESRPLQTGPSPFPLLVLVLIIMVIFLVRLRGEEQEAANAVAMRAALPEAIQ